jgi:hypothetical protein
MSDARVRVHDQEESTAGEAVAGMLLNGLGGSDRPLTFPPQLVANQPLALVLHEGGRAAMCNRCKRGRPLDAAYGSGGALWLRDLALAVWLQAGLAARCNHLDPTRVSLPGDSGPARAAHAMASPPGSATEHRPALPQAGCARMVSQAGGVPLLRPSGEGKAAETQSFQERAHARLATLQGSPSPRSWGADAQLSTAEQATTLAPLGFRTRSRGTRGRVALPRHARSASRWAPMAWPRGGWWDGHRQPLRGLRRVARKPVSVQRRRSTNSACPCQRSVLSPQARRHRPWQRWPTPGALTRGSPRS